MSIAKKDHRCYHRRYTAASARHTMKLGRAIARRLKPGSKVFLYGDLGCGKTVLAKGIARELGVREEITSPSFVLITEYTGRMKIVHIDLYRLNKNELPGLPVEEYFAADGVTIVEWSERLGFSRRRPSGLHVKFRIMKTGTREIIVEDIGD